MDAKALRDLARRYQDNKEFITNEEMTKASLIVPFITALGYDTSSPREVRLEYTANSHPTMGSDHPIEWTMQFSTQRGRSQSSLSRLSLWAQMFGPDHHNSHGT